MPRFAPKLCCVPAQNGGGLTARDPGHLIKWFIAVVVTGVGVNLLSGFVVVQKWAWLPAAVFVAALLVAVPSTGLLRRERYFTARARGMALLALIGYLAVGVWGSMTGWPLAVMILSVAYLWEAGVMLTWPTLRSRADLDHVAVGTACLLVGSAFLLLGVANPLDASTLGAVAGLLVKVAFLLGGVAALLLGVAVLLDRWDTSWGPVPAVRSHGPDGRSRGLAGGMDTCGGRAAAGPGHGPSARGRIPAGQMDTGWGPVPARRGRRPADRCCGLAAGLTLMGITSCCSGSRSC